MKNPIRVTTILSVWISLFAIVPTYAQNKVINVNLYGSAIYNNSAWNNWNVASTLTSPVLKYSDGTSSTIVSVLSSQTSYADNGPNYPTTMCPQIVGMNMSYATAKRYDTLKGLSSTKLYDIQLYATRGNPGQTTRFTINNINIDIATNNNYANAASFTNIAPVNGRIIIALTSLNTYNYLNGFTITEKPSTPPNQLPTVNAGADQLIVEPDSSTSLSGTAADADGMINSYVWSQVNGAAAFIESPSSSATNITGLLSPGVRVFRLTVIDDKGGVSTDDVTITVNPSNFPPTANAGTDKPVTLPASSASISGSGNDIDGTIVSYLWTQISGTAATITDSLSASTTITDLNTTGPRVFRLTVTDNKGATATDDITITVTPANQPPTANAGADKSIQLPTTSTSLSGSGSDAEGNVTYSWSQVNGTAATIASPSSATTNITGLSSAGTRTFRLTVRDNLGLTATDEVIIVVNPANQAPVADAGPNQNIFVPATSVTLTGSGTDGDGTISKYAWSRVSGPNTPTIVSASSPTTLVNGLVQGSYVFRLTVTDNQNATGTKNVTITVSINTSAPVINVTQQSLLPGTTDLIASIISDYPLTTTKWTKFSVPAQTNRRLTVVGSSTSTAYGLASVDSGYVWRLKKYYKAQGIIDTIYNLAVSGQCVDQVDITTALNKGAQVLLANYPSNCYDTYTVPYVISWHQRIKDSCDKRGVQFYCTGAQPRDAFDATTRAKMKVINDSLRNRFGNRFIDFWTPMTNSSNNTVKTEYGQGDGIHINALGHEKFFQLVRAANIFQHTFSSTAVITNPDAAAATISNLAEGTHKFQVSTWDNRGFASSAITSIFIAPSNQAPVARAGADRFIAPPLTALSLNGSGSTDDHNIVSYHWTKIDGPDGLLETPDSSVTVFSNLIEGVYTIELMVIDDSSAMSIDTVLVTVSAINQPPIANAGADKNITLPTSTVLLSGSASDPEQLISSYEWTQISGPAAVIQSASTLSTNITGLTTQGTSVFRLTVTDNAGNVSSDEVTVIVAPAPPVQNKVINVNLYGSAIYNNAAWNNWNVGSTLTSPVLKYSDGTASTIVSVLSSQTSYADNGPNYPTTMCPQIVGMNMSYAAAKRYDTLKGLDNSKLYDIQLYASRNNPGQTTRFTINNVNVDIATHNNYANAAKFTNVAPVNGRIIIALTSINTYNYLNGFTITEKTGSTGRMSEATLMTSTEIVPPAPSALIYPNPVSDKFNVNIGNDYNGTVKIRIYDQQGVIRKETLVMKAKGNNVFSMQANNLAAGMYVIKISGKDWSYSIKMLKL